MGGVEGDEVGSSVEAARSALVRLFPASAYGVRPRANRNIDVVVTEIERLPMGMIGGFSDSSLSMLAESVPCELILHPVGQFLALRKYPAPPGLNGEAPHDGEDEDGKGEWNSSTVLAKPWPSIHRFLKEGSGKGATIFPNPADIHDPALTEPLNAGVTAFCVSPNEKLIAVCHRLPRAPYKPNASGGVGGGGGGRGQRGPSVSFESSSLNDAGGWSSLESSSLAGESSLEPGVVELGGENGASNDDNLSGSGDGVGGGGGAPAIEHNHRAGGQPREVRHDARIVVYHVGSPHPLATLACPTYGGDWCCVGFSADSRSLVTVSSEQKPRVALWQWRQPDSAPTTTRYQHHHALAAQTVIEEDTSSGANRASICPAEDGSATVVVTGGSHVHFCCVETEEGEAPRFECFDAADEAGLGGEIFVDHVWLAVRAATHSTVPVLAVLAEATASVHCFDASGSPMAPPLAIPTPHGADSSSPSSSSHQVVGTTMARCGSRNGRDQLLVVGAHGLVCLLQVTEAATQAAANESLSSNVPVLEALRAVHVGTETFDGVALLPLNNQILLYTRSQRLVTVDRQCVEQGGDVVIYHEAVEVSVGDEEMEKSFQALKAQGVKIERPRRSTVLKMEPGEITENGPHLQGILSMSVCQLKPLLATVGADRTLRVWNHDRGACEVKHTWPNDDPTVVAFHPTGTELIVGFRDRVRLYSVLHAPAGLGLRYEWALKHCLAISYSHGGNLFATAAGINILIHDACTFTLLHSFTGHIAPVSCLVWARNNQTLYSTGTDGNVYGWNLLTGKRSEETGLLNRSMPYVSMVVNVSLTGLTEDSAPSLVSQDYLFALEGFDDDEEDGGGGSGEGKGSGDTATKHCYVVVGGLEGGLRELKWDPKQPDGAAIREFGTSGTDPIITCMHLDHIAEVLYAGTAEGTLRVYQWPLTGVFIEFPGHAPTGGSLELPGVRSLALLPNRTTVLSAGSDGLVLASHVLQPEDGDKGFASGLSVDSDDQVGPEHNGDTLVVSQEFVDDLYREREELAKAITELTSDLEFGIHRKDAEWGEKVRKCQDARDAGVSTERNRREKLEAEHSAAMADNQAEADALAQKHMRNMSELENGYEAKLGVALRRYEFLKEEIQRAKEQCVYRLEQAMVEHRDAMEGVQKNNAHRRRILEKEVAKLEDECHHDTTSHRETLMQQEEEYEGEVASLMEIATDQLHQQRAISAKLRAKVQVQNTKVVRVEKKIEERQRYIKQMEDTIVGVDGANADLEDELARFGADIQDRQEALNAKEGEVAGLAAEQRQLENFRFVLDAKLAAMQAERVPLTDHVGELDDAREELYGTLIQEFQALRDADKRLKEKGEEEESVAESVQEHRLLIREKERLVSSFKRELSLLVEITTPEDLVRGVADLLRRFVPSFSEDGRKHRKKKTTKRAPAGGGKRKVMKGGEGSAEDAAGGGEEVEDEEDEEAERQAATAADAAMGMIHNLVRQRDQVTKVAKAQAAAIKRTERLERLNANSRLQENMWIVDEVNRLRRENIENRRSEYHLERELERWVTRSNHDGLSLKESLDSISTQMDDDPSIAKHSASRTTLPLYDGDLPPFATSAQDPRASTPAKDSARIRRGVSSRQESTRQSAEMHGLSSRIIETESTIQQQRNEIQYLYLREAARVSHMRSLQKRKGILEEISHQSSSTYLPQWSVESAVTMRDTVSLQTRLQAPQPGRG